MHATQLPLMLQSLYSFGNRGNPKLKQGNNTTLFFFLQHNTIQRQNISVFILRSQVNELPASLYSWQDLLLK